MSDTITELDFCQLNECLNEIYDINIKNTHDTTNDVLLDGFCHVKIVYDHCSMVLNVKHGATFNCILPHIYNEISYDFYPDILDEDHISDNYVIDRDLTINIYRLY